MLAKSIAMPYQLPDCTIACSAIMTRRPGGSSFRILLG